MKPLTVIAGFFPVLFVCLTVVPGPAQTLPRQQPEPATIQIDTNLVVLHISVRNKKEVPARLEKENFQVYEDGILQSIESFRPEDIPVTVGLVVDNSGSMRPKRTDVIAAGLAFARSSNPKDQIFVVNFNEYTSLGLPEETPFTDDVARIEKALSRNVANGLTALYDALAVALTHIGKGNRDKQALIVFSDGGDNASTHSSAARIIELAGRGDVIIYAIGIFDEYDRDQNFGVLKRLAKATGGEAFHVTSGKDAIPVCERIARDLRTQYSLAYSPTNQKYDGTFRTIQVRARGPRNETLTVRTRTGYFAPVKP